jgi:hypothetical protein
MCSDFRSIGNITNEILNRFQTAARLSDFENGPDEVREAPECSHTIDATPILARSIRSVPIERRHHDSKRSNCDVEDHSDHLSDDRNEKPVDGGTETDREDAGKERSKDHRAAVNERLRSFVAFERRAALRIANAPIAVPDQANRYPDVERNQAANDPQRCHRNVPQTSTAAQQISNRKA